MDSDEILQENKKNCAYKMQNKFVSNIFLAIFLGFFLGVLESILIVRKL